jgi:hypothetical protein
MFHCARLLTTPHRQSHREIISTWHITTGEIRDGPGQPLDAQLAEVSDRSPRAPTAALGKCATISASGRHVFRVMRAALSCQGQVCLMRIFISHAPRSSSR